MKNKGTPFLLRFGIGLVLSMLTGQLYAQFPELESVRNKYADAAGIYLKKVQEYKISLEKGVLCGSAFVQEQIVINTDAGVGYQSRSVGTSGFIEAKNIKAYTYIPKGSKFEKREVEKIELKADFSTNSFYDDEKEYNMVFPSVQPGAVLDLSYELKYNEPRFMGGFYFSDYIPVEEKKLVISVQKNITIGYKYFNCDSTTFEFTKEEKKNEIVYTWKRLHAPAEKFYSDAPNYKYFEPHLVFYIKNYTVDGKSTPVLGTAKELYSWYADLQKNVNKTEDRKLRALTDSLVKGLKTVEEKVQKVFYWVQDNISYVAFEDGLGGFIPRDAGLVCSRKYGDCKDMASIIHEMLRMAGVTSYLAWIGSRDIPYTYIEIATPSVDNHMIVCYKSEDGAWHFLDGTGKKAPYNLFTSFIQGKQAMVGVSPDSFDLVTVPVKDTSVSQTVDSTFISIENNQIVGIGKVKLSGYDRLEYIYREESLNKKEQEDLFKNYFAKGNNKVSFSNVQESLANKIAPLTIDYHFTVPDYVQKVQNEVYINLNLNKGVGLEQIPPSRKAPISFRHHTLKRNITVFEIPTGYKVDYVPADFFQENEIIGFRSTYVRRENKIIHTFDFYINTLLLTEANFDGYNKVLNEQIKTTKQSISLVKL